MDISCLSSLEFHRKAFSILFHIYVEDNFLEESNAEIAEYYSHDDLYEVIIYANKVSMETIIKRTYNRVTHPYLLCYYIQKLLRLKKDQFNEYFLKEIIMNNLQFF